MVGTILSVANLMAYSEPGTPISYSSFIVTVGLSRSMSEIFACETRTDRQRSIAGPSRSAFARRQHWPVTLSCDVRSLRKHCLWANCVRFVGSVVLYTLSIRFSSPFYLIFAQKITSCHSPWHPFWPLWTAPQNCRRTSWRGWRQTVH